MKIWRIAALTVAAVLTCLSTEAFAQAAGSTITGVVRDTSGAVLPGVTVEAASPALIEKVRSTVTDAEGLYRLVDLRPGDYTVTFTLPGFNTFVRDGMTLPANFTATVNAEMGVGALSGNHHGDRRGAARRHPEHAAADRSSSARRSRTFPAPAA